MRKNSECRKVRPITIILKPFQLALYIIIQLLFIPLAIAGLIVAVHKEFKLSKKYKVSFSGIKALQYRWFMHYFETRPDSLSVNFTKHFPCESHWGMMSLMGPLIIAQKFFGFRTKIGKLVEPGEETIESASGIRVLRFDTIMEKYIDQVEQVVIPGAGFDLIALHYTKNRNVKVYELDQTHTLQIKLDTMRKAGIAHDWITYIPVDYSTEFWIDKLLEAGFDKTKKTLFLWQSVSLYLDEQTVKQTLREMAELSCPGSIIAQDFYSTALFTGEISKSAMRIMNMINKMGEPWKFTIDMSEGADNAIGTFLSECGLKMTSCDQFGKKLDIPPYYCIIECEKE